MKKKVLVLMMATVMSFGLVACSDDEYEDTSDQSYTEDTSSDSEASDDSSDSESSDMEAVKDAIESSIWQDDADGLYYTFGDDGVFLLTNLETQESVEGTYEVVIADEALMIEITQEDSAYELFVSEYDGDTMVLQDTTDGSTINLTVPQ